jgi:hypothetical protein
VLRETTSRGLCGLHSLPNVNYRDLSSTSCRINLCACIKVCVTVRSVCLLLQYRYCSTYYKAVRAGECEWVQWMGRREEQANRSTRHTCRDRHGASRASEAMFCHKGTAGRCGAHRTGLVICAMRSAHMQGHVLLRLCSRRFPGGQTESSGRQCANAQGLYAVTAGGGRRRGYGRWEQCEREI